MIEMRTLDRFARAWLGRILTLDHDAAHAELSQLRPGDITEPHLLTAARAIWLAVDDGDDPTPRNVADAAYRHGLAHPDDDATVVIFLFELQMCTPPARAILDAPTTPAYMARTLQEVNP